MSITSGFYDSLDGDRRYSAKQMSELFDGIINDGVLANIGDAFAVTADTGNTILVGTGRAWFNSTWIYNDSALSLEVPDRVSSNYANPTIHVLVLEVDRRESVRAASIKFIESFLAGVSDDHEKVVNQIVTDKLTNTSEIRQYPLAYICQRKTTADDEVTQSMITNLIGTSHCPFVTGILQVQTIDMIVAQWESQFETWFAAVKATLDDDTAMALAGKVTSLEDGTTPAGNASKLGNQDPSYYAKAADVNAIVNGTTPVGKAGNASKLGNQDPSYYAKAADVDSLAQNFQTHGHPAEEITAGYFGGVVRASPTAVAAVTDSMVRNIYAGTTDMTAGSTTLASGAIYVMYE